LNVVLVPSPEVNEGIAQIVSPLWTGALTGSHANVIVCLDTIWYQSFSGMAKAIRAQASVARLRLIPMGVWCDVDRNRRSEKTDAIPLLE
jgi:hypothetical protein